MAILTRADFETKIKNLIGDRTDDEAISIIEDVTDTLNDYDSRVGEDWKAKYEENDNAWRQRYIKRFNEPSVVDKPATTPPEEEPTKEQIDAESITYDDLFSTVEGGK